MMKPLRKSHLQIWLAWTVLLPVGIVMSWLAIPNQQPVKLLQAEQQELLPVLFQSADKKDYWVNIRTKEDKSQWQLEWINKYELAVPSAVIYRNRSADNDMYMKELIGRIEARGSYVFPLNEEAVNVTFILYDFIHERIIDSVVFKTPQ
jgi:hypothetical protein